MAKQPQDEAGRQGGGKLNPGDVAPPGTPGTGENICPDCQGSGKLNAQPCRICGGTGMVVTGIAGG
jgi:DnaJ-class molecular chaperone